MFHSALAFNSDISGWDVSIVRNIDVSCYSPQYLLLYQTTNNFK